MLCPIAIFHHHLVHYSISLSLSFFFDILSADHFVLLMLSLISRYLNSVDWVFTDCCKAIAVYFTQSVSQSDLLIITVIWWDASSFATCLVASRAPQTKLLPDNKHFYVSVLFYVLLLIFYTCLCAKARARAFFSLFIRNYKPHASTTHTRHNKDEWKKWRWKLRITANILY